MRHFGASEGILRVIQGLIQLTQYRCRAGKILSESFTMQRGFKEGCPASPVEFNFLQEGILRTWRRKMAEHGPSSELTITCGIPQETDHAATRSLDPRWLAQHADEISVWQEIELDLLCFADDTNMLHRESVAARRRTSLTKHMEQWGATVHPDKWQHLRCRRSPSLRELDKGKIPESIPLNPEEEALRDENMEWDTAIEMVGSWLAENGDNTRDLSERLRKARKVWYILCKQLPGLRLNHSWSIKLWQSTVMACLLYGCEVQFFSQAI